MSRLPPLNALKAFEAAARHLSFTRGAQALNVTQSAISHQVRLLEEHLGQSLFHRSSAGLRLTRSGASLYDSVHRAFQTIVDTVDELEAEQQDSVLNIGIRPFLSFNWLAARLSGFYDAHPDVKIRLHHTNGSFDFAQGEIDLAILLGEGNWPDMDVEFLMPCELTPVCSPMVCGGQKKPRRLSDLRTNTLLHEGTFGNWPRWLALSGEPGVEHAQHVFIDDTNVRIQAAIKGQGVALSNPKILAEDITKGSLIAPFDVVLADFSYYVVSPKHSPVDRNTRIFKNWLSEQASAC